MLTVSRRGTACWHLRARMHLTEGMLAERVQDMVGGSAKSCSVRKEGLR